MSYAKFLTVRVIGGVLLAVIIMIGLWTLLNTFKKEEPSSVAHLEEGLPAHEEETAGELEHHEPLPSTEETAHDAHEAPTAHGTTSTAHETPSTAHKTPSTAHGKPSGAHGAPSGAHDAIPGMEGHEDKAKGVAFVEATIAALEHELNERFWGWRCNDIIQLTDNVENIQLGVLEVVRRTSVALAERISRYGPTDVIDHNLENAMNWFMIKPTQYWLPSPEDKYNDSIKELRKYAEKLEKGEVTFYTRADNLIPLLLSFADLLGSCDDNLVKTHEDDGSPVSWFKVDDYFYYAKGVAMAMGKILHAVEHDFATVLEARGGTDLLEHAIHACHEAGEIDPWLVTDAALDGILANHRANMAAPISHARHYLDVLAKTLST